MGFSDNRGSLGHRLRLQTCTQTFSLLFAGIFALSSMPLGAEENLIYKTVADDGSVQFTDQAAPDAVVVTPSPLNIVDAPANQTTPSVAAAKPVQAPNGSSAPAADDSNTITSVSIDSPTHQETLIDHQGPIWVKISTAPSDSIPAGLTAEVMLNGERVTSGSSDKLPISVPERGTHQLQIKIVERDGSTVATSAKHSIHVKQRVTNSAD
ncbi:MAG: hypothetical protein AB8B79_00245 [Granulosicoccus sp.]